MKTIKVNSLRLGGLQKSLLNFKSDIFIDEKLFRVINSLCRNEISNASLKSLLIYLEKNDWFLLDFHIHFHKSVRLILVYELNFVQSMNNWRPMGLSELTPY